ncbi:MAG: LamG domain-containing protein, partial [Verrucomicrobiales bacterium]
MIRIVLCISAIALIHSVSGEQLSPPLARFEFEDAEELKSFWPIGGEPMAKLVPGPSPSHGRAISFADTDGCLVVPYSEEQATLGKLAETGGITVAFWVRHRFEPRDHNFRIMTAPGVDISMMRGPIPATAHIGGSTGIHLDTQPHGINALDGKWHHVAITVDFGSARGNGIVYIDGHAGASRDVSILRDFDDPRGSFIIGARNRHGVMGFRGDLDDLRFYDRALNPHEVAHLVGGELSAGIDQEVWLPQEARLQGHSKRPASWSLDDARGATIEDPSKNTTRIQFSSPGEYTATLSDESGARESVVIKVHGPAPPSVILTGDPDNRYSAGTEYSLHARVTSPYETTDLALDWEQVSGPADAVLSVSKEEPAEATITFPSAGLYEISATSSIGKLEGTDRLQFLVRDSEPTRHYTTTLDPTYSLAFESAPSRSPLLREDQSGNTGYRYFCSGSPLPRMIQGARPFTGYAADFTNSEGVGAVFNRHSNKDFGNLRSAEGMGVAFWVKGTMPNRNANIIRAGGLLITADSAGEHATGLHVQARERRYSAVPEEGEDWNLFDG